jgi:hypothetical protein
MGENILPEKTYGSWTVIGRGDAIGKHRLIMVLCSCGNYRQVQRATLLKGKSTSCGCKSAEKSSKKSTKHGFTGTRTYESWRSMKRRCGNINDPMYYLYGGKGITVCERWARFENFLQDMGKRPINKTIDRIDNSKGYYLENCQWATCREQALNRKTTVHKSIEYCGQVKPLSVWADELKIKASVLYARIIKMKWSVEKAFTQPVKRYKKCPQ